MHNGKNLLSLVPFNKNNINIYGTKLLSRLFNKRELSEGSVEPIKAKAPPLDQRRIDMIKSIFFVFLFNFNFFNFYIFLFKFATSRN